jgi:formate dehydrogenase major subunit
LLLQENDTHYRPISWTDATERIVQNIKTTSRDKTLFYTSGRSSNEAGFLLKLIARQFGTNNVNIDGDVALFTGIAKALFDLAESNPS